MRFGPNGAQVTILRRVTDDDGRPGDFAPAGSPVWARWTQAPGVLSDVAGQREDAIDVVLTVNDSPFTRTVSNADRATFGGNEFEIKSAGLPERKSGSIALALKRVPNT